MGNKLWLVQWIITGKIEVSARNKDEAEEIVCNDYDPDQLVNNSIMLDVDVENTILSLKEY